LRVPRDDPCGIVVPRPPKIDGPSTLDASSEIDASSNLGVSSNLEAARLQIADVGPPKIDRPSTLDASPGIDASSNLGVSSILGASLHKDGVVVPRPPKIDGPSKLDTSPEIGLTPPADTSEMEERFMADGEVIILDNTFPHYVYNDASMDRFVLMAEIWHPNLTEIEVRI